MSLHFGDRHLRVADQHDGFICNVGPKGPLIGLGVDFRAPVRQGPRLRRPLPSP